MRRTRIRAARRARLIGATALAAAAIVYMAIAVYRARDTLRGIPWSSHPALLSIGIIVNATVLSLGCTVWWMLLAQMTATRISASEQWRIWALTNPSRYVPGRIWHVGSITMLMRDAGVAPAATVSSLAVHMWFYSLAACVVGVGALIGSSVGVATRAIIVIGVATMMAIGTHPRPLRAVLRAAGRVAGQPLLEWRGSWLTALGFVAVDVVVHVASGVAIAVVLIATLGVDPNLIPRIVASNAAGFLAGYVSLAPVGIGVREAAMTLLLRSALSPDGAAVAAVITRVAMLAAEVLLAVVALAARAPQRPSTDA